VDYVEAIVSKIQEVSLLSDTHEHICDFVLMQNGQNHRCGYSSVMLEMVKQIEP